MLGKLKGFVVLGTLIGSYQLLKKYPISITNPQLNLVLQTVNQYKPEYTVNVFKILMKMRVLGRDQKLEGYMLGGGFDVEGKYLEEVELLGFKGLVVGPVGLNPTTEEESSFNLGVKSALANIYSYKSTRTDPIEIHLRICPNHQILKIAPYLLKENLLQSIEAYCQIQKLVTDRIVRRIVVDFDNPEFKLQGREEHQVNNMLRQTTIEIGKVVQTTNETLDQKIQVIFDVKKKQYLEWSDLFGYMQGTLDL